MRRQLAVLVSAVTLAALVGSVGPATAGDPTETLVVTTRPLMFEYVDLGRAGQGPGDLIVFRDELWDEEGAERIGTRRGSCVVNSAATVVCTASAHIFGRGSFTGAGAVRFARESYVVPIVGGSGEFERVSGEAHVLVLNPRTGKERVEFHLFGT